MKKKIDQPAGQLIYGLHPLKEVLKAKRRKLITIYITKPEPKGWQEIAKLLPKYPIQKQVLGRDDLTRMVDSTDHQGIVALVQAFPFRKKPFDPEKNPHLLMLDGIQDPRNLGGILRSAYCTGIDGVILVKKNSAPLNAVALKSSAGLAEHLEILEVVSAQAGAHELKNQGYHLYLATLDGKNALDTNFQKPLCLVIGGEGFGISKTILSLGTKVTLPQRTPDISYNASVAAGILLFLVGIKQST